MSRYLVPALALAVSGGHALAQTPPPAPPMPNKPAITAPAPGNDSDMARMMKQCADMHTQAAAGTLSPAMRPRLAQCDAMDKQMSQDAAPMPDAAQQR